VKTLRAIGWDHPRCVRPMRACADAWREERGIDVVWNFRSLEAFGDQPLEQVARHYDLLVIDHPFCGTAAASGCLAALDELVDAETLSTLAADAVGPSHMSYSFAGHQWAFATDSACQVAAFRPDLLGAPFSATWGDVLELARSRPGRVAMPLAPAHAISSFLSLCANNGAVPVTGESLVDEETGVQAVSLLTELASLGPAQAIAWEPPDVLALLTSSDELDCVPLTYGFVTYSRTEEVAHPCRFTDIPSAGGGPVGAVLGGAGLAVSSTSRYLEEAAAFAAWASGEEAQRALVTPAGGQPGNRSAWLDPELDARAGGFFSRTLATIEASWVRPREDWWPAFQREAGHLLTTALADRASAIRTFTELDSLYRDCIRRPK
jgi:multiple sugar transport system substrate-binding protein